MTTLKTIWK